MKKELHFFEDSVKVGDELWFSVLIGNALCRKNLTSGELEIVYQFEASPRGIRLYSRVFFEQGILYFIPGNADTLAVYRIADKKCRYFDVPKLRVYGIKNDAPFYHYGSAVQIGRGLYMFSLFSPEITVFDMDKETMETVYFKELDSHNAALHHTFGMDAAVWDGKIYLTVCNTAKLLEFNTKSYDYRILEYPVGTVSFSCMAQNKDLFYITDNANADIICYKAGTGKFDLLCRSFAKRNTEQTFIKSIFWNQKLYLFQNYSDFFYIYNIQDGFCSTVKAGVCPSEETERFSKKGIESKYFAFRQTEHELFFYYAPTDAMFRLDRNGELLQIPFLDSHAKHILNLQRLYKLPDADIHMESLPGDLELLIKNIFQTRKCLGFEQELTVGEQIHRENRKGM